MEEDLVIYKGTVYNYDTTIKDINKNGINK
jgi:hypothetical protein